MSLSTVIAAAIVSLAPQLPAETVERYASDIVDASQGEEDLALALVATQDAESAWRSDVETCKVVGDGGRARTAFQLHHHWWGGKSAEEVCSSNRLAASLAASALIVLSHRTGGMRGALRAFIGCKPGDPRSVRRLKTFAKLQKLAKEAA